MNGFEKTKEFLKENGHRIFTFMVGLTFIGAVFFAVAFTAVKIYRVFVPNDIYADEYFEKSLYGGSVYEAQSEDFPEEGTEEFFENYIENFIRQDMPDFDDPTQLNDEYMISFGLWQAIKLNNTQNVYTFDSNSNFRVPKSDVEMFVQYCFDFSKKIDHRTVDICGKFKYNLLNGTYKIRSAGVEEFLVPDVIKVQQDENENTYTLTVDCYRNSMDSVGDPTNDPTNFHKRVQIILQDMGIQDYTSTGNPVHRYIVLSMDTVDITEDEAAEGEEQTDTDEAKDKDDIELN